MSIVSSSKNKKKQKNWKKGLQIMNKQLLLVVFVNWINISGQGMRRKKPMPQCRDRTQAPCPCGNRLTRIRNFLGSLGYLRNFFVSFFIITKFTNRERLERVSREFLSEGEQFSYQIGRVSKTYWIRPFLFNSEREKLCNYFDLGENYSFMWIVCICRLY